MKSSETIIIDGLAVAPTPGMAFPNLELLSLCNCPIKTVTIPNDNGSIIFPHLHTLWMSYSKISDLQDLEGLRHLPALKDIRLNGIPYLQEMSGKSIW